MLGQGRNCQECITGETIHEGLSTPIGEESARPIGRAAVGLSNDRT
jgi:hypothetical protein